LPGDDEVAAGVHADRRFVLIRGRISVDLEFAAERRAARIVAARIDAPGIGQILVPGGPCDDEIARGIHRYSRHFLIVGGGLVDPEFTSGFRARCIETLGVDTEVAAVLPHALPDDDKSTVAAHGNLRLRLIIGGRRIDMYGAALRRARGVVALRVDADAGIAGGAAQILPDNDIIAAAVHGDRTIGVVGCLDAGGSGVRACLAPLRRDGEQPRPTYRRSR
jgi:hypothetical protein